MNMKNNFLRGSLALISLTISLSLFAFDFGDVIKKGVTGGGDSDGDGDAISDTTHGFSGVSLREELDKGGPLAIEIAAQRGGLLKNEAMTKRVATIGKALTLYTVRPDYPWFFAVLNNDEVTAMSAPGGYVFVTKGLVEACKNDNQLAAVLAHEISHVTQRHALKVLSGGKAAKGTTQILGGALSIAGVDTYGAENAIGPAIKGIITHGLPKADEYDADKVGTVLARDAGFPPHTLRDFLESIKDQDSDKFFSHHPKIEDRIDRLNDQIKAMGK
jgi:predicted Zn-dependent protease